MKNHKLLIVDDDLVLLNSMRDEIMRLLPSVEILAARSLLAAKEILVGNSIDLAFVENKLPDGKGHKLLTDKNASLTNSQFVLSSCYTKEEIISLRDRDIFAEIFKPFVIPQLRLVIYKFIDQFLVDPRQEGAADK